MLFVVCSVLCRAMCVVCNVYIVYCALCGAWSVIKELCSFDDDFVLFSLLYRRLKVVFCGGGMQKHEI